jgi:hypothetical protein
MAGRGAAAGWGSEFEVEVVPGPATALVVVEGPEVGPAPELVPVLVLGPVPGLVLLRRPWLELRLRLASVLPRRLCEDDRVACQCRPVVWACAAF